MGGQSSGQDATKAGGRSASTDGTKLVDGSHGVNVRCECYVNVNVNEFAWAQISGSRIIGFSLLLQTTSFRGRIIG
jgi:hypothetical protein